MGCGWIVVALTHVEGQVCSDVKKRYGPIWYILDDQMRVLNKHFGAQEQDVKSGFLSGGMAFKLRD